ncbi:uncharacterized protein LOC120339332 [Styela clava]
MNEFFKKRLKRNKTDLKDASSNAMMLSAAYIEDAIRGRYYQSGLARNLAPDRKFHLKCFNIHSSLPYEIGLILTITLHSALAFFEPVQMINRASPSLPTWVIISGILSVFVYSIDICLSIIYTSRRNFISSIHNISYIIMVFLLASDYIIYTLTKRMIFRFLRATLLLVRTRTLRGTTLVMLWVIPKFIQFLSIMVAYIGIFAVVGVHLFMQYYEHEGLYLLI